MKSFVVAICVTSFLIGACLAIESVGADSGKDTDILIPEVKDLAMQGADQVPAETKHWWYGHKYDWNKKGHGEHDGGHGEGKHGRVWWWKWH